MIRLVKLLSYYPLMLISSFLLLFARIFGWGCLFAFLLVGGFKLAGELAVSGWIVAALLGGGVVALVLADAYVGLLVRLDIAQGQEVMGGGR